MKFSPAKTPVAWFGAWMLAVGYVTIRGHESVDFLTAVSIGPYTGVRGHVMWLIREHKYPMPTFP